MKTKDLPSRALLYCCVLQAEDGTEEKFKAMSNLDKLSFILGLIERTGVATWKSGESWRASFCLPNTVTMTQWKGS